MADANNMDCASLCRAHIARQGEPYEQDRRRPVTVLTITGLPSYPATTATSAPHMVPVAVSEALSGVVVSLIESSEYDFDTDSLRFSAPGWSRRVPMSLVLDLLWEPETFMNQILCKGAA